MTYQSITELCISFSVAIVRKKKCPKISTTHLYVVLHVKGETHIL